MKKIGCTLSIAIFAVAAVGCSFLQTDPKVIVADTFYNSEEKVEYGLTGVYGVINTEYFYGAYYSIYISNPDDLGYFGGTTTSFPTLNYTHDPSTGEVYRTWSEIYEGISNANYFMEAIEDSEYDPDHKSYNEARFLRAFYHFILAQTWGDVPLRDKAVTSPSSTSCPATPQYEVLKWAASEMEACLDLAEEEWTCASRVTKTIMWGMLARVYLFMAGETVAGNESFRHDYYGKAVEYSDLVIKSGLHQLNPDYTQVFKNMMGDLYDTEYKESMWEAEFLGGKSTSSSSERTSGRIGDVLGLRSDPSEYDNVNCNYSNGSFYGSLKLWNLYWSRDRTEDENRLDEVTDARQEWNMRPYNYRTNSSYPPYPDPGAYGTGSCVGGVDKAPYTYNNITTSMDLMTARANRNCGKWSREVEWEGIAGLRSAYTGINFPILRYSDVLLMYAEAENEYNGVPSEEAYDCVKQVRDRAGIKTRPYSEYTDYSDFQELVRNERARELCFEGLRKYDLIRWGIFVQSMRDYIEDTADSEWRLSSYASIAADFGNRVQEKHIVMPIPLIELGVNKELDQNPLW